MFYLLQIEVTNLKHYNHGNSKVYAMAEDRNTYTYTDYTHSDKFDTYFFQKDYIGLGENSHGSIYLNTGNGT